jgi:hypothetical protein
MDLNAAELQILLECIDYSIQRVTEAQGTPNDLRQNKLQALAGIQVKLRKLIP